MVSWERMGHRLASFHQQMASWPGQQMPALRLKNWKLGRYIPIGRGTMFVRFPTAGSWALPGPP